jgi:hypothetical protein
LISLITCKNAKILVVAQRAFPRLAMKRFISKRSKASHIHHMDTTIDINAAIIPKNTIFLDGGFQY